jgi:hypothetical protein
MVDAGKKIKCPYFISSDKKSSKIQGPFIRIYDSKIAMMIELYGGINNYMDSIKARR